MAITAAMVKELREKTGLGMMNCKKALTEADGDMTLAIENLRKKGQATAAKRAGKSATEGAVISSSSSDCAIIFQVNCETDFVANGDDFVNFTNSLSKVILNEKPSTVDAVLELTLNGKKVSEGLTELMGKLGEKIEIKSYSIVSTSDSEANFTYVHSNKKVGAIVKLAADKSEALSNDAVVTLGKELAMQVSAFAPISVNRDSVDSSIIDKEKEIYTEQLRNEGKPEAIIEKILIGKVNKFYKDVTLLDQEYIKDDKKNVTKVLSEVSKAVGATISIVSFDRVELGNSEDK